jgi:hypothetical protein
MAGSPGVIEGVIDPPVDLGRKFLLRLLGPPDELRVEIVRLLLGQRGAAGHLCGQLLDLLAGQAGDPDACKNALLQDIQYV